MWMKPMPRVLRWPRAVPRERGADHRHVACRLVRSGILPILNVACAQKDAPAAAAGELISYEMGSLPPVI